jgi:hypothetical protein
MHPIVEGVARAAAQVGGKAIRRAIDSVMEDGERAADEIRRDIEGARIYTRDDVPPFEVRQVYPEDPMAERERRRRRETEARDDERDGEREEHDDDPPPDSGEMQDIRELTDLRDAETFLRHSWMLLADLAEQGVYPKSRANDMEDMLNDLRERIDERENA